MDEGAKQSQGSNPGARLAAAREQAGMTLQQAAESLRLDLATLQALEAGRFQALGAAVFVRGHLRHYAELLGLPAGEIDAAYEACSGQLAPLPDLRRTTTLPGTSTSHAVPPAAALIGAIALVLIALVWWAMRVPTGQRHVAGGAAPALAAPSASAAAPTSGPSPREGAGAPAVTAPAAARSEPAGARTEPAAAARNSTPASKDAAAAKEAAAASKDATASKDAKEASAAKTIVRLAIRFNQDSWAEVYDARRVTLYHDFGGAGSERRVTGAAPLRVLIGNPDGVALELDGHPVALRPAAESGKPQRFLLDSTGRMSDIPGSQSQRPPPAPALPPEQSEPSAAPAPATAPEPP